MPDKEAFGPDMKWSEEARAKRSEAAKKAAATRARKKAEAAEYANYTATIMAEAMAEEKHVAPIRAAALRPAYPYYQGSRVARLAVCGVSHRAFISGARHIRWYAPTHEMLRG